MTGKAVTPPDVKSGGRRQSPDPRHTAPKRKGGGWPSIPPSKSFTLWLPNEDADRLRALATKRGCSVATLIRHAVSEMLQDDSRSDRVPQGAKARAVRVLRKADPA
jgi:hypothetical protein